MSYKDQHLYVLLSDDHDPTFGSLDNALIVRADLSQDRLDAAGVEPEQVLEAIIDVRAGREPEVKLATGEEVVESLDSYVEDSAAAFRVFTGDECLALAEAMLYFEEHGTRKGDAPVQYKDGLGNIVDSRKRISVLNSIGEKLGLT